MEDIPERYERLTKIFYEENLDVKKAEQSLFLIENSFNNLQNKEKQISEKFLRYKGQYIKKDNIIALKNFIASLQDQEDFDYLKNINFDEDTINANLLLFTNIDTLLNKTQESEKELKLKQELIDNLSKIEKGKTECEKLISQLVKKDQDNIPVKVLAQTHKSLKSLENNISSLRNSRIETELIESFQIQSIQNMLNEWNGIFEETMSALIQKLRKFENKNINLKKEKFAEIMNQSSILQENSKVRETLKSFILDLSKNFVDLFKSANFLSVKKNGSETWITNEGKISEISPDEQSVKEKLNQISNNFEVIWQIQRDIKGIISKNIFLSNERSSEEEFYKRLDEALIQILNDTLFPLIKNYKQAVEDTVLELEFKCDFDLILIKETIQNFQSIELLKETETKLIEWKDDFFQKIQSIQESSDSKNNENFYRQIVNVVKELNNYLDSCSNIKEPNLEKRFISFEAKTLKLILLVLKIIDEKAIKKTQQILNLKSSSFVVIQDLILNLINFIEEREIHDEKTVVDLKKIMKYFNNQEINTWMDLKTTSI